MRRPWCVRRPMAQQWPGGLSDRLVFRLVTAGLAEARHSRLGPAGAARRGRLGAVGQGRCGHSEVGQSWRVKARAVGHIMAWQKPSNLSEQARQDQLKPDICGCPQCGARFHRHMGFSTLSGTVYCSALCLERASPEGFQPIPRLRS
jgi:hypothetical protein